MRSAIPIAGDIYWVGVNDLETDLFEAIWPLPQGITYNSYLIADQKIALIDTVKSSYLNNYIEKLRSSLPDHKSADYLIINHMEPDHSGSVKALLDLYPEMCIIGNKKTAEFLESFYGIRDRMRIVNDQESISLGSTTLTFTMTPMVHWPETMMTYADIGKVLFSGDVFGGFGAFNGGIFDDEVDMQFYEHEILRYFSNIIGKYSPMVQQAIRKIEKFDIQIVASTHGPIFRSDPAYIIKQYGKWSEYSAERGVTVVYGSMYGNTQRMAEVISRSFVEKGIRVAMHNVSREHISYAIADSWRYKAIVLGAPTYNAGLFPLMNMFIRSLDSTFMRSRISGIFGSYSWSGGGVKTMREIAAENAWQLVEPVVEVKSAPTNEDLDRCELLTAAISEKMPA